MSLVLPLGQVSAWIIRCLSRARSIRCCRPPVWRPEVEEARQRINRWVGDLTEERIRGLLPLRAVNGETAVVLSKAMHLKDV